MPIFRWFDRTYVCTFEWCAGNIVDVFIVVHRQWGSICRRNVTYALSRFLALACKVISSSTLTDGISDPMLSIFFSRTGEFTRKEAGFSWLIILVIPGGPPLAALMTRIFTFFFHSVDILRCWVWAFAPVEVVFLVCGFWVPHTILSRMSDSLMHSQKLHVCESVRNATTYASKVSSGDWFQLLNK